MSDSNVFKVWQCKSCMESLGFVDQVELRLAPDGLGIAGRRLKVLTPAYATLRSVTLHATAFALPVICIAAAALLGSSAGPAVLSAFGGGIIGFSLFFFCGAAPIIVWMTLLWYTYNCFTRHTNLFWSWNHIKDVGGHPSREVVHLTIAGFENVVTACFISQPEVTDRLVACAEEARFLHRQQSKHQPPSDSYTPKMTSTTQTAEKDTTTSGTGLLLCVSTCSCVLVLLAGVLNYARPVDPGPVRAALPREAGGLKLAYQGVIQDRGQCIAASGILPTGSSGKLGFRWTERTESLTCVSGPGSSNDSSEGWWDGEEAQLFIEADGYSQRHEASPCPPHSTTDLWPQRHSSFELGEYPDGKSKKKLGYYPRLLPIKPALMVFVNIDESFEGRWVTFLARVTLTYPVLLDSTDTSGNYQMITRTFERRVGRYYVLPADDVEHIRDRAVFDRYPHGLPKSLLAGGVLGLLFSVSVGVHVILSRQRSESKK